MKRALLLALAVVCGSAAVSVAEGVPSKSKLSKLGLSSMTIASDVAGAQVRGAGWAALGGQLHLNTGHSFPFGFGFFPGTFAFPNVGGGSSLVAPINATGGQLLPATADPAQAGVIFASQGIPGDPPIPAVPHITITNSYSANGVNYVTSASITGGLLVFGQ